MVLERELQTYERKLPDLLVNEGKFVLIQDEEVIDTFDSYEDALKGGYERFGVDTPFLVKQIQAVEAVQFITRDIAIPCLTSPSK